MAHILLIDDDSTVRAVLRLTLTHFGHDVTEASNGQEGLQRFDQGHPDLVITDIVMPDKDGLEFLMELRSRKTTVKIIAMSGGGRGSAEDYLRTAQLMGAAKTLAKPFTQAVLLAAVNELLPEAKG